MVLGASSAISFTLMSWLYCSPFTVLTCALLRETVTGTATLVIRYPTFAIVFGKSNCGKTSPVDTSDDVHVRLCAHSGEAEPYHARLSCVGLQHGTSASPS